MATSGSKSVAVTSWDTLRLSWSEKSQNVANNITIISWKLELIATGSGHISSSASKDWSVTINGTRYSGTNTVGINNNSTKTLASGTTTITHNDDGTKTFNYSFSQQFDITFNGWIGTISGSGSGTLDTIPRASQPSCITWPDHTQNVGSFGDTISIHMNRASDAFTHTVRYQFGSASGTIATGVTTGTTWTIPKSLMSLIPNALSGSGTIYADTYSGNTKVGTKYCGFTATVPNAADCYPTCHLTLEDTTGWDDTYGSPVQGLSKIKITATPTLAYGSPITSYALSADGAKYTTATATTGALKTAGDSPITVTIKDKRGRTGTASYTMKVQAYALPNVSKLTVHRCDEDGTENAQGEYIQAVFSASITALNNKNTAAYKLRYKKSTASNFTEVTLSNLANTYAVSNGAYTFAADSNSSYDVEIEAKDRHGVSTRSTSASTAFTLMNWGADGTSMGIGKVAEKLNALEIALKMFDRFDTHIGNGLASYGGSSAPIDANTTIEHHFLTTVGTPTTGLWHVVQYFYSSKTPTANRLQMAMPYNRAGATFKRYYINGTGWSAWESDALQSYPVGSIYIAYNHTNPSTLFGGTWTRMTDGFLWASRSTDTIGQTGGAKTHTLTVNELPAHNHGGTYTNAGTSTKTHAWLASGGSAMTYESVNTGGGQAHNNMPPYIQVSIWRRTA
jgi:hypothetical protein